MTITTRTALVFLLMSLLALFLTAPAGHPVRTQAETRAGTTDTLAARIATVLPTPQEERWLEVPWRMDLDQARAEAQRCGKPLFLWINEGHPLGCV